MANGIIARSVLVVCAALLSSCSGGGSDDSGAAPQPAESLKTVSLPSFPHSVDIYDVDNADKAVVVLHGGAGHNYEIAYNLGLNSSDAPPTQGTIDWAWLHDHKVIAVFPQGQAIASDPSDFTWTNHVMTSGQDDMAFLQALASYIRTQYGVSKVYLMGHSNGGMMANRMWCESPTTFDGYVSIAGPASEYYLAPATSCAPGVVQPYFGIVGDKDDVLQVNGNWPETTWRINPVLTVGSPAFVDPVLIGEWHQQQLRSQAGCGTLPQLTDSTSDGKVETWTECGNRLKLQRVLQGQHSIDSLEAAAGYRMIDAASAFIDGLEQP